MSDEKRQPFYLVPEFALLSPLSEHRRQRFEHALKLMHEELEGRLSWEQIATESAISPYHFHRQFTQLFNETPGQYLSRLRLQYAVHYLLSGRPYSVTDIAQYCGFSSSQALGKALKRDLGMTAKAIRAMAKSATPLETANLVAKLAHPLEQSTLERELAQSMPCEVIWYPRRGLKKLDLDNPDWDLVFEQFGKNSLRLMGASPTAQLDKPWDQIDTVIGDWQVDSQEYDYTIPEGHYLCCDVYLISDVGYSAALEALFDMADKQGHRIDVDGLLVEMIRDIELSEVGGVTFSFQIRIK